MTKHTPPKFGIRAAGVTPEIRVEQIAGNGRVRLTQGDRLWWAKDTSKHTWEVYPADEGQTYDAEETALDVARRLS